MLAESYFKLSPPYPLDQSYTNKAKDEYQAFMDFFPKDPKVDEADKKIKILNEKLAQKDYQSGMIYEKMDYFKAAIKYYGSVVEIYHDTKFAPMALYRKILIEIKRSLTNDAISDVAMFLSRYPNDSNVKEIQDLEVKIPSK
jgi:outer membrane protein assembly factor BamD